jgi:hypothetical protein
MDESEQEDTMPAWTAYGFDVNELMHLCSGTGHLVGGSVPSRAEFMEAADGFAFPDFQSDDADGAAARASLAKLEALTDIQYADLLKFIEAFNEVVAHMENLGFLESPNDYRDASIA